VAICLTLATVGCGEDDGSSSNPETTSPTTEAIGPSTPSTAGSEPTLSTSGPRVPPVGAYGAGWSEIGAGIGYLELVADGTGRVLSLGVDLAGPREDRFTFEVAGDRLTVTSGADGAWGCNEGQPGIYEWALAGTRLELDAMDEPCAQRATAIQLDWGGDWSWYSLGDAPIVETGLGDAPVAVDTPIGTIEWTARTPRPSEPHILPESNLSFEMMTPPSGGPVERVEVWTLESGFLMRDAHRTYWTSPDHSQWAEATGAPSDLTIEATFGDAVYGTVGRHEDVTSTDGGHTWQAADRPGGAGDLFAVGDVGLVAVESAIFGPCVGVVFVSADGTTWQRALNPWPPPAMGQPTIVGDSIVIPAGDCGGNVGQIEWIRVGQIEWIGTIR
jgi:hypothetical protein